MLGMNLWPIYSHHPTIFCNCGFNFFQAFIYSRYFGLYDAVFEALISHCFALIVCLRDSDLYVPMLLTLIFTLASGISVNSSSLFSL